MDRYSGSQRSYGPFLTGINTLIIPADMLNQLPTTGTLAAPRAILKVGSKIIEWTCGMPSTTVSMRRARSASRCRGNYADWPWWTQQTEILVDVYVGFPKDPMNYSAGDMTLLQTYRIDSIRPNWQTLAFLWPAAT
ncbi:hypothetical protein BTO02_33690 (plasmid) [Paraburkholderia sp. SOS3]|nr:hypothetical protein BTO02_33690 [Paraburkholderia sp. SOS3]